uniref:Uncharacterized protein n=1 Tax=Setaria viridis TaxID=4556 RepID=A0A4U6TRU4_SETVI|nr:hypothetical protein SEVIR_7G193200v2 [Setaria viridis]
MRDEHRPRRNLASSVETHPLSTRGLLVEPASHRRRPPSSATVPLVREGPPLVPVPSPSVSLASSFSCPLRRHHLLTAGISSLRGPPKGPVNHGSNLVCSSLNHGSNLVCSSLDQFDSLLQTIWD